MLNSFNATFANVPGAIDPMWGNVLWGQSTTTYTNTCPGLNDSCCQATYQGNYTYSYNAKTPGCVSTGNGILDFTNLFRSISVPSLGVLTTYVPNANKFCTPSLETLQDDFVSWGNGQASVNLGIVTFPDISSLSVNPVLKPGNSEEKLSVPDSESTVSSAIKNLPTISVLFYIIALLFRTLY